MLKATPKTIGPNLDFMADGTEIPRGNVTWPRTHSQDPQGMFPDSVLSQTCHCSLCFLGGRGGGCLGVYLHRPCFSGLAHARRNQHLPDGLVRGREGSFCFFLGGTLLVWRIRMGTICNMALQYLSVIKKHKTLLPASMRALSMAARGLPDGLQRGHMPAACLTRRAIQSVSWPFSAPGQDAGPLPKAHTFLAFLRVSEQLLQALFSCVDLFFIVPEIHPEAFGTQHRQSIQPKAQVHTNRALWDLGQVSWNDIARKGGPRSHLTPTCGPRAVLRTNSGWDIWGGGDAWKVSGRPKLTFHSSHA